MRWLAAHTGKLTHCDWYLISMERVIDLLEKALIKVENTPNKFLNEEFMLNTFDKLYTQLPTFKKYMDFYFSRKKSAPVNGGTKLLIGNMIKNKVFTPRREYNIAITRLSTQLGKEIAIIIFKELQDVNKVTHEYQTSEGGDMSFGNANEDEHQAGLGKSAVNDYYESPFGGLTAQIE